jgi:hypothetical protein
MRAMGGDVIPRRQPTRSSWFTDVLLMRAGV